MTRRKVSMLDSMKTSQNTNPKKKVFTKYMQEKLAFTVVVITLALFSLIYVLYRIVEDKKDSYNQIVLSQQEYDSRVIPFRRGDIVDRNGTVLATTEMVYNLIIDPKQIMSDKENYLETTVGALTTVFGYDPGEMRRLITENAGTAYVRYARQLSIEEKEKFEKLRTATNQANSDAGTKARVKGVWFEEEYKRNYLYGSLACNVIGFVTTDGGSGNTGIEQYYNNTLIGNNGREYGYLNDDSNLERVIKPAVNGNTVVSTIDMNVQSIVEKYIKQWQQETGSDRVGVIVMDPNNGEILAMANDRFFDLNNPRDLQGLYTSEQIVELGEKEAIQAYKREHPDSKLLTKEQVRDHYSANEIESFGLQVAWNQIWRNFCISDTFEPGSTSKIFTIATGLEEGVLTGNETFFCDGVQEVGGWPIRCVKRTGHGNLTVAESLMQSCNDAMMQMAAMEGRERFSKYQKLFGFGAKTGIDLPGEADTKDLIYHVEDMKPSDLATNSFGQNYNCTMIQMAAAYCSVINGGSYYTPHVVKQIQNEQGSIVKKIDPLLVRETVSENTSNFLNQALYRTVSEGTGKAAIVEGYEVGGKTGTAEKLPRKNGDYLLSFCGFAPADDPQVLVYVVVDTPHVEDQPHSSYASGIFQKIMSEVLPRLNVFPTTDSPEMSEDLEKILPESEGITDNQQQPEPESEPETKVYETDEVVEDPAGGNSGIPGAVPGHPDNPEKPENPSQQQTGEGQSIEETETGIKPSETAGISEPSSESPGSGNS